jgi:solute carrier family 25 (mitochondrial phosphate transporter), member 23/24/25/41
MNTTAVVSELELELQESQNQRDRRVEALWQKLDPQRKGELDLKGFQRGFRQIDHRKIRAVTCTSLARLRSCSRSTALKNADSILKDIVRAVDTNGDGKIQYEGSFIIRICSPRL